jgi:hypothetical protein
LLFRFRNRTRGGKCSFFRRHRLPPICPANCSFRQATKKPLTRRATLPRASLPVFRASLLEMKEPHYGSCFQHQEKLYDFFVLSACQKKMRTAKICSKLLAQNDAIRRDGRASRVAFGDEFGALDENSRIGTERRQRLRGHGVTGRAMPGRIFATGLCSRSATISRPPHRARARIMCAGSCSPPSRYQP